MKSFDTQRDMPNVDYATPDDVGEDIWYDQLAPRSVLINHIDSPYANNFPEGWEAGIRRNLYERGFGKGALTHGLQRYKAVEAYGYTAYPEGQGLDVSVHTAPVVGRNWLSRRERPAAVTLLTPALYFRAVDSQREPFRGRAAHAGGEVVRLVFNAQPDISAIQASLDTWA